MRHLSRSLFTLWLLAAARLLNAADVSPVEAFGTVPQIRHVSMSPDGSLLASTTTAGSLRAWISTRTARTCSFS
jgi:hypothetical protein